ncbi:hypothetical protein FOZ62_011222 [Perkinsus olseni]|uniref:t-SNARE coiled-coil homology domain-containing protein n=1 Tax=Perkinsus olseni TaxID=32597 RepID=A0A7J6NVM5_PEROL|nr:hypothetical protein FOZ62_011222 [Perkinsus olseni]
MKGSKESGSSSHLGRHPPPLSHYECAVDDPSHEESHGLLAQELEHRESGDSHAFVDERVVHERHAGISRIHEQVQQVSDMFRDLAVMVSDQGQQISSVENTVETTVSDSKEAVRELEKAARLGHSISDRSWCVLVVATVILVTLFAAHRLQDYINTGLGSMR